MHYCTICQREIDADRLDAVPDSQLCLEHARAIAKFGGEFLVSTRNVVTSKQGSLKKNYGGVNVSKRRNESGLRKLRDEYERARQAAGS